MSKMEILEKAGSTDILILITKHKGKMYLTKLHEDLGKGSMSTLNMRLLELKNQGLIKDEQESKFGGRRNILSFHNESILFKGFFQFLEDALRFSLPF
jgi:DNA-binding transcriptional ArsR family regulator